MLQKFHIWIAQEALVFDSELWAGLWESPVNLCVQLDVSIAVTCAQISSSSSLRLAERFLQACRGLCVRKHVKLLGV